MQFGDILPWPPEVSSCLSEGIFQSAEGAQERLSDRRLPQTARNHVIRARRHVFLAFRPASSTPKGRSLTSGFIALNFILCHVRTLKSTKITLFQQIGYNLWANK